MAVYVLVHGAWHGGWCWRRVATLLRAAGHEAYTPTLTGLGERAHLRSCEIDLNTHVQDVIGLVEGEDLHNVILVGHSLGGVKILQVADRIPSRLRHLVNIDGMIPTNGRSIKDMIPGVWKASRERAEQSGDPDWVPPPDDWGFGVAGADLDWLRSKLTADPIKSWETPFSLTNQAASQIPRTFIHCTQGQSQEEIASEEASCLEHGWAYRPLAAAHDAMVTDPAELTGMLVKMD
jgi:pimeloyl-ACP methyl ester carboxylesterase